MKNWRQFVKLSYLLLLFVRKKKDFCNAIDTIFTVSLKSLNPFENHFVYV